VYGVEFERDDQQAQLKVINHGIMVSWYTQLRVNIRHGHPEPREGSCATRADSSLRAA